MKQTYRTTMKLTILACEAKRKSLYLLSLKYGDQEFMEEIMISKGVVPYAEYSERLQHILHKDVGQARNMNQAMFKIYRDDAVDFPVVIGDF